MSSERELPFTLAELRQRLREVDPGACLVPPRILRRVIKHDRAMSVFALRVPHRKTYVISRKRLLAVVEPEELGFESADEVPERVLLLVAPQAARFEQLSPGELVSRMWRLLFHARLDAALEDRLSAADATESELRRRVSELGQTAFDEVTLVLRDELFLFAPFDQRTVYAEFAAVFFELYYFLPPLMGRYFPSLDDVERVAALLRLDVDAERLFRETRPAGAPLPALPEPPTPAEWDTPLDRVAESSPSDAYSPRWGKNLEGRARRAEAAGNSVRAAIVYTRLAAAAPGKLARTASKAAAAQVEQLTRRLQSALNLSADDVPIWRRALESLLSQTRKGFWTREARLLYDLQKACLNHERETFTVDVLGWARSFGRRPLRRPLPRLRQVHLVQHLRSAAQRLNAARLREPLREPFAERLAEAETAAGRRVREQLRPALERELDAVGLTPANVPERVSRGKVLEELLDRVLERGFLSMADLRDALSRNQLKLPDLPSLSEFVNGLLPPETPSHEAALSSTETGTPPRASAPRPGFWAAAGNWFRGTRRRRAVARRALLPLLWPLYLIVRRDHLLQLDRRLDTALDGVYRAGEFYLRALQRFSSLLYGTLPGRFFTRFGLIPFGGSFVILYFLDHVLASFLAADSPAQAAATAAESVQKGHKTLGLYNPISATVGALIIYGLIYQPRFRNLVMAGFSGVRRAWRTVIVEPCAWLVRLPLVRIILASRPLALALRFLIKPAIVGALIWLLLPRERFTLDVQALNYGGIFLAVNFLLNSRTFRTLEEKFYDNLVVAWYRLRSHWLAGLFRAVVEFFRRVIEFIERLIYAVDERLRFRTGDSPVTTAVKYALGPLWAIGSYLLRTIVNLFVEPQINPIKHFPVVTVSHKILIPMQPALSRLLHLSLDRVTAELVAGAIVLVLPGAIGFLVWELKENWRLYAANRPGTLQAVLIGSHGETMIRFMRLGLHSGALPKLFARLRRAERRAYAGGSWRPVRKQLAAAHHAERALGHFVQRELLPLVHQSAAWRGRRLSLGHLHLGGNNVRMELECQATVRGPLAIEFQEQSGRLLASIACPGWLTELTPAQRQIFRDALFGLYHLAGVDLVREQIDRCFPPPPPPYDVAGTELLVWPGGDFAVQFQYDLARPGRLIPATASAPPEMTLPELERRQLIFAESPVAWADWVRVWSESREAGHVPLYPETLILPPLSREPPRTSPAPPAPEVAPL